MMNVTPVVSILVVTYNQESYIGKTLDCLLMQECPFDYEILIGEDCSTDQTKNICIEYSREYPDKIRLFLNEQNKGLIDNYFDLLEHARGTYLADCGGDDYWLKTDKLKRQVELLVRYPEVGLVYGNWQKLYQKNNLLETNKTGMNDDWFNPRYYGPEAIRDYLNGRNFPKVVLSTSCFRTNLLKDALQSNRDLFRGKSVVCEDLPITLCLLAKSPFYLMKEELMVYRVLENSSSHSENLGDCMKGFSYKVFLQTLELAFAFGLSAKDLKLYLRKELPNFIYYAFVTKDKEWMNLIIKDIEKYAVRLRLKQWIMYVCTQNKWTHFIIFNAYRLFKG